MSVNLRFLILAASIIAILSMQGQRTTRPKLKLDTKRVEQTVECDTLKTPEESMVKIRGYEKALRSSVESMFVINDQEAPILEMGLTIEYLDMTGRQLHSREVSLKERVPAHETRKVEITSWDSQKVWHYYRSDPPRTRLQATPYQVRIKINYVLTPKKF